MCLQQVVSDQAGISDDEQRAQHEDVSHEETRRDDDVSHVSYPWGSGLDIGILHHGQREDRGAPQGEWRSVYIFDDFRTRQPVHLAATATCGTAECSPRWCHHA